MFVLQPLEWIATILSLARMSRRTTVCSLIKTFRGSKFQHKFLSSPPLLPPPTSTLTLLSSHSPTQVKWQPPAAVSARPRPRRPPWSSKAASCAQTLLCTDLRYWVLGEGLGYRLHANLWGKTIRNIICLSISMHLFLSDPADPRILRQRMPARCSQGWSLRCWRRCVIVSLRIKEYIYINIFKST